MKHQVARSDGLIKVAAPGVLPPPEGKTAERAATLYDIRQRRRRVPRGRKTAKVG